MGMIVHSPLGIQLNLRQILLYFFDHTMQYNDTPRLAEGWFILKLSKGANDKNYIGLLNITFFGGYHNNFKVSKICRTLEIYNVFARSPHHNMWECNFFYDISEFGLYPIRLS